MNRHYLNEFYFMNVPKHIDGGFCCIRVRRVPQQQAHYVAPEKHGWNQHDVAVGARAYSAILKWAKFLGAVPTVYASGEISSYTHQLDYSRFDTLLALCLKESGIRADICADSPADSVVKVAVADSKKLFQDADHERSLFTQVIQQEKSAGTTLLETT